MLRQQLWEAAQALGFAHMFVCGLPDYGSWRRRVTEIPDKHYAGLTDDPAKAFEGPCIAVVLVCPYLPYELPQDDSTATISAYYPASDAAHHAALQLEDWLVQRGYRAKGSPNIPFKPIIAQSGQASYGRNGITAMPEYGSRYTLQVVLTDAPLEIDVQGTEPQELSRMCLNCGRCVRACPSGALDGTGRVDVRRCVRAQSDEYPMREEFRRMIGRSLYGCDICQDVCPRNADIPRQSVPQALHAALRLEKLLSGDVAGLIPYIGKNFARKARMQAKACVIAANLHRTDLRERIAECQNSPVDFVKDHAQWALTQLDNY